jgi:hypothetical protein
MKSFLLVIVSLFAFNAFSSPKMSWVLIGENHEEENTHSGIRYLISKYPHAFSRYEDYSESNKLSRISVETFEWHYFGVNTCLGNDIRLEQIYYSVGTCLLDANGAESCSQSLALRPATETDPCQ